MDILYDNVIFSKVKNGGVSNYWFELIKFFETNNIDTIKYFEDCNTIDNFHRNKLFLDKNKIIQKDSSFIQQYLPISEKITNEVIYHSSYYRALRGAKYLTEITTVHDFIHNYYSDFPNKQLHNFFKFSAIKRSKGIICVSKNTFNDLNKLIKLKNNQKIEVIYNGVSNDYFPINSFSKEQINFIEKHKLNQDFFLFIGNRTNYKNFDFVVSILNNMPKFKLVLIGGGNLSSSEKKQFNSNSLKNVIHFNNIENKDLNLIYNLANALFYPSSYEGFGIPYVEAMKAACPVIGLNTHIFKEITGGNSLALEKLSIEEFKNKWGLLKNTNFKNDLLNKGLEHSKLFSWEKCCKQTREFYKLFDN